MTSKKNSGFSMVEILISLAILSVLIVPIVSGIVSGIKQTSSGKELQYRNEFAQNLLEYAKEDSLQNIATKKYFESLGSYNVDFQKLPGGSISYYDGPDPMEAEYEEYRVSGSMNLGPEHTTYSYVMELSSKYYAEKQATDTTYVNPNNLALGVVEDIDYTKVALINGTIANYDAAVSNAFMTRKLQILKEKDPERYEQFISQVSGNNPFYQDKAERNIIIKVEDETTPSGDKQYRITCTLRYTDSSTSSFTGGSMGAELIARGLNVIEYVPYSAIFEELPNIYLMYNVCVYNGIYSNNDYILYDIDDLNEDIPVNVFVVETASGYSEQLAKTLAKESLGETATDAEITAEIEKIKKQILYNNEIVSGSAKRDNVNIYMAAKGSDISRLHIYHNFDTGAAASEVKNNEKNKRLEYSTTYGAYGSLSKSGDEATIRKLNEAQQESRGLYQVKVWMSKGTVDQVDTSTEPLITGTKGGSES